MIGLGAIAGGLFGRSTAKQAVNTKLTTEKISDDFGEALEMMDKSYVRKLDREQVLDRSIQSMLFTLDPHSSFFTQHRIPKALRRTILAILRNRSFDSAASRRRLCAICYSRNTPADKAGIQLGDRFVDVEGKDAKEWTSAEVSKNVRGEKGSSVNVKVERAGSERTDFIYNCSRRRSASFDSQLFYA